jgi:hypothetical protein
MHCKTEQKRDIKTTEKKQKSISAPKIENREKKCKTSRENIFGERTCVTRFLFAVWALATVSSLFSAA